MATITEVQKTTILDLQAKLTFIENQLLDLQTKKNSEIETLNVSYKESLKIIVDNYTSQISQLENSISNLKSQLEAIK